MLQAALNIPDYPIPLNVPQVQGKEGKGVMEAYDILKQVLDMLPYFNHLHVQFVQYLPKSIGATDIPSLIPGNIEAELDAELALLKAKPGAAGEQKRDLQSCLTNTKGLIFIAMVEGLDPVEIVHRLLSEVLLTKDFKGRFCQRLTPITHTRHPTPLTLL